MKGKAHVPGMVFAYFYLHFKPLLNEIVVLYLLSGFYYFIIFFS